MGLTKPQVGKLDRWFATTYAFLLVGDFRNAKKEISDTLLERGADGDSSLLETVGMLDTAQYLNDSILDYFNNKYDL